MPSCGVCLGICVCVTFVDHVKTSKHIFEIFSPSSHTILVVARNNLMVILIALLLELTYSRIGILFRGFFSRDIAFLRKAYTVYVRPILEYASRVWSPHFIKYINSIENVQRHFTKRISSITNLPYLERLAVMDLEPLELRRIKTDLTMYFKIYNNLSALSSDYLPCDNSVRTYHSRMKCEYIIQPLCRTQLFATDF